MNLQRAFDEGFEAVKAYVDQAVSEFEQRIAVLAARMDEFSARPAPVSIVEAIKGADGVLRLTLSDGRMLDTGIRDGAPGQDAITPDFTAMVAAAVDPVRGELSAYIDERVAQIPVPRDGDDAKPEEVAAALRDVLMPDVAGMIAERFAAIEVPAATVDPAMVEEAVQRAVSAIPPAPAGKDVDMAEVRTLIAEEVAKIPAPKDGESVTLEQVQPLIDKAVSAAVDALPPAQPGKDADMDLVRQFIREEVGNIPTPKDGETPSDEFLRELVTPIIADAVAAIPPAAPGKDADPEEIRRMVDEAVSRIPVPKDGVSPTPEEVRGIVEAVVAEMPKPKDGEPGKDVDMAEVRSLIEAEVEARVAEIPVPKDGEPGRLPIVKAWEDRVYYAGEVCSHDGATWQASVDTGRTPPHADWTCIAAKGRDGADAPVLKLRGTYDEAQEYEYLSVVMLNGASFVARRDNPGACPGEGWQMLAQQGKRGSPGPVTKGDRGPCPSSMTVDDNGMLALRLDDGTSVECDLYPLLSRL